MTECLGFHTFADVVNFKCKYMAKPIAPTPPLTGQDALDFLINLETKEKATPEEKERIKAGAERIRKMVHFKF